MFRPHFVASMFSVALMIPGSNVVLGQEYPNKPVRIVTAAPGGGSDFTSRQIAQGISGSLGQPVIVENRGSGIILYEFLAKAPPDGYGLVVTGGSFWITPLLQKMPYDVPRDFLAISLLVGEVSVVAVHPSLPVKSIKELIALAKAKPGELNYSSSAVGAPQHLAAELFKSMGGVNIVRVAYKGAAPAITALLSGEVQMTIFDVGLLMPHIQSGKLRGLAVTSAQPSVLAPGLPTVAASGLPGYEVMGMTGIWAPGRTPAPIIRRLNQEIVRFLGTAEAKERFRKAGIEVVGSSPEEAAAFIKADMERTAKVIKDANIRVE